jgi:flagellar basal body P-ring protein FlgI
MTCRGGVFSRQAADPPDDMTMRPISRCVVASLLTAAAVMWMAMLPGCGGRKEKVAPATPPPPVYTGPGFLRGTVGSMARLRGYEPMLVSGWGMVVNLQGTGSTSVPAFLRQWLINHMRLQGVGSARLAASGNPLATMSAGQIIADPNTAVVEVFGLIPPGAPRGTRFDLVVSAVEGTQTTSLEQGVLLPGDLGVAGSNRRMQMVKPHANARGPIYVSPRQPMADMGDPETLTQRRKGVIIAGGVVTEDRRIELVLNQPSWQRSRDIADRINERFPRDGVDRRDTAVPNTDMLITINIPIRYHGDPERLLALISNLFVQRAENFELVKAQQLADVLAVPGNHAYARDIVLAWEALGRPVLPVLQRLYSDENIVVALAALEAGAKLGHELVSNRLSELAGDADPQTRRRVAEVLGYLPGSVRGATTLRRMVDDADDQVRLAAYESLVTIADASVQRVVMGEYETIRDARTRQERRQLKPDTFKFALDLVPAKRPLVYAAQTGMPRVVIFNPMLEFDRPMLAQLWDNHLMLRADEVTPEKPEPRVSVFYQGFGQPRPKTVEIAPTLANLAFLMAHKPTIDNPTEGLDLTYSQVVHAVFELCNTGAVPSPVLIEQNPLIDHVESLVRQLPTPQRPESETQLVSPLEDGMAPPPDPGFIDLPTQRTRSEPAATTDPRLDPRPDTSP